jgi:hypothetical protein
LILETYNSVAYCHLIVYRQLWHILELLIWIVYSLTGRCLVSTFISSISMDFNLPHVSFVWNYIIFD